MNKPADSNDSRPSAGREVTVEYDASVPPEARLWPQGTQFILDKDGIIVGANVPSPEPTPEDVATLESTQMPTAEPLTIHSPNLLRRLCGLEDD